MKWVGGGGMDFLLCKSQLSVVHCRVTAGDILHVVMQRGGYQGGCCHDGTDNDRLTISPGLWGVV
jgi:hypothetical protein